MKTIFTIPIFTFICLLSLTAQELTINQFDLSDIQGSASTTYFAEDGNGEIWALQRADFSFDGETIAKYDGNTWSEVEFDECFQCSRRIIGSADGTIYLGTTSGIYTWTGSAWNLENSQSVADADMDFDSQGNLWFKTGSGGDVLAALATNGNVTEYPNVAGAIFQITVAPDDKIWLRIADEVVVFDGAQTTTYNDFFTPLDIEIDGNGVVWVTNSFGEIGKIENGVATTDFLENVTISGVSQTAFAIDANNDIFWFGQQTMGGLVYYDGVNTLFTPWEDLFEVDFGVGLVNEAFVTSTGSLWISANFQNLATEVIPDISSVFESNFSLQNIYPNPSTEFIQMELPNTESMEATIQIINTQGQLISSQQIDIQNGTFTQDVQQLSPGQYFVIIPELKVFGPFVKMK